MAYPQRLLADDETVVLDLHPHWKSLVGPAALLVVLAGLASYAVTAMPAGSLQGWARLGVLVAAALLLGWFVLRPWLRWSTTHFVFTTHRVLIRRGVLARHGRDIPLSRINDVTFARSPVGRLIGCGTLIVESGGERGQLVLADVPAVEEVQRELYRLVEADDARRRVLRTDRSAPGP